jgi:uncharacterized protein YdaU (DUF1376 family)
MPTIANEVFQTDFEREIQARIDAERARLAQKPAWHASASSKNQWSARSREHYMGAWVPNTSGKTAEKEFHVGPTLWWSLRIQMNCRVSTAMGGTAHM